VGYIVLYVLVSFSEVQFSRTDFQWYHELSVRGIFGQRNMKNGARGRMCAMWMRN
jgi:hypothetical protein